MTDRRDAAALKRDHIALLVRTWGTDEREARELLRVARGDVDLASDAWLDAGEQLYQGRVAGEAIPRDARLAIALGLVLARR